MGNRSILLNIIKNNFSSIDVSKIDASSPLERQGLDSLDMTTFLFAIEGEFGTPIPTAKVSSLRTLEDIEKFLDQKD
ncbi:acyl carrier protein [Rhizobium helianthi]|uniref:Acyl carrier protein n=1 Tax=Rhizobium helianthi TaxID=1132695 RepID=A0ABW4M253_9HYPH